MDKRTTPAQEAESELVERQIIMRASQCGHHRKDECQSCEAAWESNDYRIQTLEGEITRLEAALREAREDFAMCVAEMARARGRIETIAGCNEDRRIAASLGSTCDYLRSRWFDARTALGGGV